MRLTSVAGPDRGLARWLFTLLRPFFARVMLSVLLGTLTIASSIVLIMTSAWLISKCALQPSITDLGISIVAVRFFGISRGVFRYLERLVSHDTTFRILAKLRVDFYRAIEPLAPARLSQYHTGDLLTRVMADIEALQEVYLRAVAPTVVAVLTAIGATILFGAFDSLIALVILSFMLVAGIVLPVFVRIASRDAGRALVNSRADLNTILVDELYGQAEIHAYGCKEFYAQRQDKLTDVVSAQQRRLNRMESLQQGALTLLMNGAALAVLAIALPRVEGIYLATLTLGVFAAFEALMPLSQAAVQWDTAVTSARRLGQIIDAVPTVHEPMVSAAFPTGCDLEFTDISFQYSPQGPLVFDALTLTIRQGERVAILGSSGSGKSTLVNLLVRFWDYSSGSIRLGGIELEDFAPSEVRQKMAVMSQQSYLFNTTIMENIRIAQPDSTDEQVITASQEAHIHAFIESLPQGYDTQIGENGVSLSGGERRRIALARVLLKNAPILILDEPTAYLDTGVEQAILKSILETLEGHTLILLTHRRTMLKHVDLVYCIKDGHAVLERNQSFS